MSNCPPISDPREFKNSERPLDILIGAEEMSRTSLGKIEQSFSKYNLLQLKPRKPRSVKHPVPSVKVADKKECSLFNDPEVQEQLQNLILDVFGQKEDEQKSFPSNECEKYSSEFEKFTNNKRESILRFPYLVDRISIKSSTSIRQQSQNEGFGSLSTNQNSRDSIGSSRVMFQERRPSRDDHSQQSSQTACTNLCNDLMYTIDTHLNLASVSSADCQSKMNDCLNVERSNQRLSNNELLNLNMNKISSNSNNDRTNISDVREESHQKINPLQKVMQRINIDSVNPSKPYVSSVDEPNSNNNRVDSCTKIDEDKKKEFLHSFFGFDKVLNNRRSSKPSDSNHVQLMENEYSLVQTQSTYTKLSVSNDNFYPNNNHCNCTSNSCRSKSKICEIANIDKRTTSAERIGQHGSNAKHSQEIPVFHNDFPSEGSILNRKTSNYQFPKDRLYEKENEDHNLKQTTDNNYYNDFSDNFNRIVKDEIPRSFEMNDEFYDFDPQLSFLLERTSNSFPPSNNLVEQNVYFCDVSNNIPCNLKHSESAKFTNSNSNNTEQNKSNVNNTNNSSNFRMESHNKNQENSTSGVYDTSKIYNEINTRIQNQMREIYDGSGSDYSCNDKFCRMIYNNGNREDRNDDCTSEASPLKLSYDVQNDSMLNNQGSLKQSIDSCTCSRNSKLLSTGLIYNSTNKSKKESTLRNATHEVESEIFDKSASNTNTDQNSNMKVKDYFTKCSNQTNKAMPLSQLISLDEPDYLQHLKKLRWDHIQRISREVQRLESLERSDSWTHVDVDISWHYERDCGLIQKVYHLIEVP